MNNSKKNIHQPYQKFKGMLREKGLTYNDIAKTLDVSETTVSHKINGISDFYISEVQQMFESYGIKCDIFFVSNVS